MTTVLVASALWAAAPVLPVVVALLAFRHPMPALLLCVVWAVVARVRRVPGPSPDDEARLLDRLVAELEGGTSPRASLLAVARAEHRIDLTHVGRLIEAGMPSRQIAMAFGDALPHNGRAAAAAWALAGVSGSPAGPVIGLLARRAGARGRLERERHALATQARATAWLIAGLPLAVLVLLGATGRIGPGPALPVVVTGVVLQLLGLAVVATMLRRSS